MDTIHFGGKFSTSRCQSCPFICGVQIVPFYDTKVFIYRNYNLLYKLLREPVSYSPYGHKSFKVFYYYYYYIEYLWKGKNV